MKNYMVSILFGCCVLPLVAWAQDEQSPAPQMSPEQMAMMQAWERAATPGGEHERLATQVGTWHGQVESWSVPGTDPMVSQSKVERKMSLDGRVLEEHWSGNMMGQDFVGHGRTGFDNVQQQYWSTWTDNMSTSLMTFSGQYDEAAEQYVFTGSYVDPVSKRTVNTRSVSMSPEEGKEVMEMYEVVGENERMTMRITLTRQ